MQNQVEGDFQFYQSRKHRSRGKFKSKTLGSASLFVSDAASPTVLAQRSAEYRRLICQNHLDFQEISERIREKIQSNSVHVLVLGLGSPASSKRALMQLEFLKALLEPIQITPSHDTWSIFDPVMLTEDVDLLEGRGFRVLKENLRGAHSLPTDAHHVLLYMPNCPLALYENAIRSNFSAENLRRMILIGNNFDAYDSKHTDAEFQLKAPGLSRLLTKTRIHSFQFGNEIMSEYLNDMAVHMWDKETLPDPAHTFWTPLSSTSENEELL